MKNKTTLSFTYDELEVLYLSLSAQQTLIEVCKCHSNLFNKVDIAKLKKRLAKGQVRIFNSI